MSESEIEVNPLKFVDEQLTASQFLAIVGKVNKGIFKRRDLRKLSAAEITVLKQHNNYCKNWDNILVVSDFVPQNIRGNTFLGNPILGRLTATLKIDDKKYSCGIFNSTLSDVQVANDSLVCNVSWLDKVTLLSGAALLNCKTIAHSGAHAFTVAMELDLGNEGGGRELPVFPEINIEIAAKILGESNNKVLLKEYKDILKSYTGKARSEWSIIGQGALIANTAKAVDFYLGTGACIDNACVVAKAILLSSKEEPASITDGAIVKNAILQWGVAVESGALVEQAVLTEHSKAERHAKVLNSLIGPNSHIGEGEVNASLVGPFVGFHHQSLLIAAFWPEGKGNVGYGANIGSNHTGRKNDQEIWPGEGTFFGLSCSVKYPSNFRDAPYTVIATGVTTLPQKLGFPFSLINKPAQIFANISPAYNEIIPAWVLTDNIYMLMRNELKYKKRNKARRITPPLSIFRPDIIKMMIAARDNLNVEKKQDVYTDAEISGLGKNYLVEKKRLMALEAYTFYIKYFCLDSLFKYINSSDIKKPDILELLQTSSANPDWQFARTIFAEQVGQVSLEEAACMLMEQKKQIALNVYQSKTKDDRRGARIIDDYTHTHISAEKDEFVIHIREKAEEEIKRLKEFI